MKWLKKLLGKPIDEGYDRDLLYAAKNGNLAAVKRLLALGANKEARATRYDYCKRTALLLAAAEGHTDIVACLLAAGADKEAKDNGGLTALYVATRWGHTAVVKCLLAKNG